MHRLIPNFILEKYLAHEYQGKFTAVGMFLDIYGFSRMTDTLMQHGTHGAEVLGAIMHSVFDPLLVRIFEQGGAIIGLAGDGLMALYPCDKDENLALHHALASAWNMQQYLQEHPEWETVYGSFPISAKIGLALGDVEWGILSSRDGTRATYYFRGAAVDDASAAEHHAQAGEIVLTPCLCEHYRGKLVIQPRDSFCRLERLNDPLPPKQPVQFPPIDLETACRFIPEMLLQDGLQDGLQSEFRQAVNLFVRFPELRDADLPDLVHTLFDLQARYGGLFTRLDFGDKGCNMLIFWGAPVAYQNDIGRALNFITDLRACLDFPLQAGVTYHISRAGYMGGELHEDYTCYGWGINLASRFMTNAPVGQVWVDERVVQRVKQRFLFEHVSEQNFKGFAEKQKVYLLQGRKSQVETLFEGKIVGRRAELSHLNDFIAPLRQGHEAGTLIVWGEPGVGKSRLLYEWMRSPHLAQQEFTWAICQSDQVLQQSFNPFCYWLRNYFGLHDPNECSGDVTHQIEIQRKRFEEKLDALVAGTPDTALSAELDRLRSVLGALIGLHWENSLYEQLDAQGRYDTLLLAITYLIEAESFRNPLILVLEDVHFLDEDSLAFLPRLQRALSDSPTPRPVAILLTARHQDAALRLDPSLTARSLTLERLSSEDLRTLANNLLKGPSAPDLTQILETRAEGNPFFAEQILHYLTDEKLLKRDAQGWHILTSWEPAMLPINISAVIVARLDQLARKVKAVIQTAAILGREFEVMVLAHMLHDNENLHSELDEAERAAIWSPMSEIRYLFKHALVRDTAYAMQMRARRCELHALAVEALEKLYADALDTQYENLAYHSVEAHLPEKARRYLALAGNAARDTYQNARAEEYFTHALLFTPKEDLEACYRLLMSRQRVLFLQGKPASQQQNLDELCSLTEKLHDPEKTFTVLQCQSEFWLHNGDSAQSTAIAQKALELAKQAGPIKWSIEAGLSLANALFHQGHYEQAITQCEQSLALARQDGQNENAEAHLLNLLGLIVLEHKTPTDAMLFFEQSLALYQKLDDLRGAARVSNNLGMVASSLGDYSKAQEYYEQALHLARMFGHRHGESFVLANLAWLCSLQGDYDWARQYAEQNLRIAREIGNLPSKTFGLINLSSIMSACGEADSATRVAAQALQLARQFGNRNAEAWALTYQGHGLLACSDLTAARDAYQAAITIRQELAQPILACEAWAGLQRIALDQGDRQMIENCLNKILPILANDSELKGTDHPLRVYLTCCQALDTLRDGRGPQLWQDARKLLLRRAGNISNTIARQRFLDRVPWNREILKRTT